MQKIYTSRLAFCLFFLFVAFSAEAQQQSNTDHIIPYSTDNTHLTIWNGEQYVPLFIKGINMGIAKPGTFPGELAASRADYGRWFDLIRAAGFNTIRLYTLHYPHFYEVLDSFNLANPQHPLLFFQGVWLEEEVPGYDEDLYTLSTYFEQEIKENVDAVHGNKVIASRPGKAYGSYKSDASRWLLGYIIGREIHPPEVVHTNERHLTSTSFQGTYFSIANASATETWAVKHLDLLLTWEMDNYKTQRPVSFSSWPTLDPLHHPGEENQYEDLVSVDLAKINKSKAQAGYFASYHAYPYYPDFMSRDAAYTGTTDYLGQNSYLGYLKALKSHYKNIPLIIGEFGAPSSWGVAHYAQSGIHHGGMDEATQGQNNLRMLRNIDAAGGAGGIQFALMDEWFKRTWITDPMDFNPDRRILWHNVTAAEQNFGLLGFKKEGAVTKPWEQFCTGCPVKAVEAGADFAFLNLKLLLEKPFVVNDTLWIALDTYDADLGEQILPNGKKVNNRAEFSLMITQDKAELYVTEAYDLFGIWHGTSASKQLFRSIATTGAPWNIVRWRNNNNDQEVQYIGQLRVNRLGLPPTSMDAVTIRDTSIDIKLPWTLLNFTDPSSLAVMHDDRAIPGSQERVSDGVAVTLFYKGESYPTESRFKWDNWNNVRTAVEYKKASYDIAHRYMRSLPGNPVAKQDLYTVHVDELLEVKAAKGVLHNDLSLDGSPMEAVLHTGPKHGQLILYRDGGFVYLPEEGKTGLVTFTYTILAGTHQSEPVTVKLFVDGTPRGTGFATLYPNPTSGEVQIEAKAVVDRLELYSNVGMLLQKQPVNAKEIKLQLDKLPSGMYIIKLYSGKESLTKKVILIR
ncbi:T9SS type A sorting domain-containing protein [Pontibacter burrus]|uniref:T9SS type A sorting domain-containing protein n=1 Tax=Pontibacter burrus TaxID=2704466 RepID=A0A6B3M088_9BACT|nr:T9SS type A sorting domain-containing protein [Pontibacter burrus]NEM99047.1 T9SS type A sorting domain-containing protein [Pontibacter burrus]